MKLTSEQQAFYEYGKAVETLETRIERIRNNARIRFKMEYHELPLQFRGGLWDDFQLYYAIGDVRRKRAACRVWQRRRCETYAIRAHEAIMFPTTGSRERRENHEIPL